MKFLLIDYGIYINIKNLWIKIMIIFKHMIQIKNIENLLFTERHQINCKVYFLLRKAIVIRKIDV
jgi:hypothetical protein